MDGWKELGAVKDPVECPQCVDGGRSARVESGHSPGCSGHLRMRAVGFGRQQWTNRSPGQPESSHL